MPECDRLPGPVSPRGRHRRGGQATVARCWIIEAGRPRLDAARARTAPGSRLDEPQDPLSAISSSSPSLQLDQRREPPTGAARICARSSGRRRPCPHADRRSAENGARRCRLELYVKIALQITEQIRMVEGGDHQQALQRRRRPGRHPDPTHHPTRVRLPLRMGRHRPRECSHSPASAHPSPDGDTTHGTCRMIPICGSPAGTVGGATGPGVMGRACEAEHGEADRG